MSPKFVGGLVASVLAIGVGAAAKLSADNPSVRAKVEGAVPAMKPLVKLFETTPLPPKEKKPAFEAAKKKGDAPASAPVSVEVTQHEKHTTAEAPATSHVGEAAVVLTAAVQALASTSQHVCDITHRWLPNIVAGCTGRRSTG
jgi:hypothetical protein